MRRERERRGGGAEKAYTWVFVHFPPLSLHEMKTCQRPLHEKDLFSRLCFLHSSISLSSFPLGMCAGYSLCLSPFQFYILFLTSSRFCSPFRTAFDEISNNKIKNF
ncbi:unnamed protein product [Prunus armeniaca]